MKKNLLFFSPYQAIEEHSFVERKIASLLQDEGFNVDFLGCGGIYQPHCIAMSSNGLGFGTSLAKRKLVCIKCKASRKETWKGLHRQTIEKFLTASDFALAEQVSKTLTPENISTFEFEGFKVGRIASYELILTDKIADIEGFSKVNWEPYRHNLKRVLLSLFAIRRYVETKPLDIVVSYNSNYATNEIVRQYCEKSGKRTVFLHGALDWEHLNEKFYFSFFKPEQALRERIKYYVEQNKICLDETKYEDVIEHIRHVLDAKSFWVYSAKRSADTQSIQSLGLDPEKRTALASLSCNDEIFATDFAIFNSTYISTAFHIFKDQAEWLSELISFFRNRPELQLIIRLHPREFPNKRDAITSQIVEKYKLLFKNIPSNVVVNYPTDNISIYDLFREVDLHLTAHSTVGIESSWFELPTISYSSGVGLYPSHLISILPKDRNDYLAQLENQLICDSVEGKVLKKNDSLLACYHWLLFDFDKTIIQISLGGYWKNPFGSGKSKLIKKIKRKLQLRWRTYKEYERVFSISTSERKALKEFFADEEEIYRIKNRGEPFSESLYPAFRNELVKMNVLRENKESALT